MGSLTIKRLKRKRAGLKARYKEIKWELEASDVQRSSPDTSASMQSMVHAITKEDELKGEAERVSNELKIIESLIREGEGRNKHNLRKKGGKE